ncbi:hypothetical protein LB543_18495 [Mesorhizobium sp. ESP7-2]|uniref:hypothetical protein n=1 Tax=Mesorhizobium sp. ESP7-2 TaxID=2876622 RepID=UPI001CCAC95E|nr:hypothetical protein [Mesorhizobium sp. ESP7-2]
MVFQAVIAPATVDPRFGNTEDIAAWLPGSPDRRGRFVTGAALTIDGGANA